MPKISDAQLIRSLQDCYNTHGEVTTALLNDPDTPYPTQVTYHNRFGGLYEARERADIPHPDRGAPDSYTRARVIKDVSTYLDDHDALQARDLGAENGLPSYATVREHFAGLSELLDAVQRYNRNA